MENVDQKTTSDDAGDAQIGPVEGGTERLTAGFYPSTIGTLCVESYRRRGIPRVDCWFEHAPVRAYECLPSRGTLELEPLFPV